MDSCAEKDDSEEISISDETKPEIINQEKHIKEGSEKKATNCLEF
jgi:hypothetical protein